MLCPYTRLHQAHYPPLRRDHLLRWITRGPGPSRIQGPTSAVDGVRPSAAAWQSELASLSNAVRASVDTSVDDVPGMYEAGTGAAHEVRLDELERVYLVGIRRKAPHHDPTHFTIEESLEELDRLAASAGLHVVGTTTQALVQPNPATYVGSGKLAEVAAAVRALAADTIIIDDELSPAQQRNLEKALGAGVRIADRTALILDIFEQRARSKEGKLQVRLAAASYQMPRLRRLWTHLERQSGAGSTRGGMGELQKEVDKRLLRDEMSELRRKIEAVRSHRGAYRARRRAAHVPVVALVGYTNAGKSTLLNALTAAAVPTEDRLFATLDPTTRRATLPSGKAVLLSDTVGFIQKLPTSLIAAFRATLEEIEEADVLLHVVDVSHPEAAKQSETVHGVLEEIAVSADIPMVTVWNKVDAAPLPDAVVAEAEQSAETVAACARSGWGVPDVLVAVEAALEETMVPFEALVPYADARAVAHLREAAIVRKEEYTAEGVRVCASANLETVARLEAYITEFAQRERVYRWRRDQVLADLAAAGAEAAGEEDAAHEAELRTLVATAAAKGAAAP